MQPVDIFLNIANCLSLASYIVKDILVLRLLTIVAAIIVLPYILFRPEPLYTALCWNGLFQAVNIYRVVLLLKERKPVYFEERAQALYDREFSSLKSHQFAKLANIAHWNEIEAGEKIFKSGDVLDRVLYLESGRCEIKREEAILDSRGKGDFIGESSLFSESPLKADIEVAQPVCYVSWSKDDLNKVLIDYPDLHVAFQKVVSQYLIRKLEEGKY